MNELEEMTEPGQLSRQRLLQGKNNNNNKKI
jgi:hypothetical protein